MESSGLESNTSHQELMSDSDSVDLAVASSSKVTKHAAKKMSICEIPLTDWFTIWILCFVNLINYMDRFTIAGILPSIQDYFKISNDKSGLIQTAFVISYMIFAPLFGYLGDRYSRRMIMAAGVILWSATTLIGSYMTNYYTFMIFRSLVGIGEASYSTIAPTIISDMYVDKVRSKMLALFYFAIPVGSGLGYIVGSETAKLFGSWHWALRVTPIFGLIATVLILFVLKEPGRGEAEGNSGLQPTSYKTDLRKLCKNRSFMLSTCGFTCVAFVAGALSWWGPTYIHMGIELSEEKEISIDSVSLKFGLLSMFAGVLGVPAGSALAQHLRQHYNDSDPLICGWALIISGPFVYLAIITAAVSATWSYIFIFLGQLSLNLIWSIVADILLYVVVPTRRSTAEAFQILISHALGDAGSPYLIGVVSEALKKHPDSNTTFVGPYDYPKSYDNFKSLQYSLFITIFIEVVGGILFLLCALFIVRDKMEVERATEQPTSTAENLPNPVDNTSQNNTILSVRL